MGEITQSKLTTEEMSVMRRAGKSLKEIAVEAGIGPTAVHKRLRRVPKTAAELSQEVLRHIGKNIKKGSLRDQTVVYKALNAPRRRSASTPEAIDDLRAQFKPVDLSVYESKPCTSCGVEWACDASPVCAKCLPDTPVEPQEWREAPPLPDGRPSFTRIHPPAPCSACGLNSETGDGVCNGCRREKGAAVNPEAQSPAVVLDVPPPVSPWTAKSMNCRGCGLVATEGDLCDLCRGDRKRFAEEKAKGPKVGRHGTGKTRE